MTRSGLGNRYVLIGVISLATVAATFARADTFDQTFCRDVTRAAGKINADSPMWVDPVTRQDWMVVLCNARVVEWKKYVKRAPRPGEDKVHQKTMSDLFCNKNKSFARAIARGWRVAYRITFKGGETMQIVAKCS